MSEVLDTVVCHECDLLVDIPPLNEGNTVCCPRCDGHLIKHHRNRMLPSLMISLSGLLLFFPANFLPVMVLSILGHDGENTMVKGVIQLAQDGYLWMAFLVFFCSVLAPLVKFLLVFFISFSTYFQIWSMWLIKALKLHHKLNVWGMLDVYMIAILLSYIKMTDMGDIVIDIGLFCFVLFLIMDVLVSTRFDTSAVWRRIEQEGKSWASSK